MTAAEILLAGNFEKISLKKAIRSKPKPGEQENAIII
jgi:hypothetical protein